MYCQMVPVLGHSSLGHSGQGLAAAFASTPRRHSSPPVFGKCGRTSGLVVRVQLCFSDLLSAPRYRPMLQAHVSHAARCKRTVVVSLWIQTRDNISSLLSRHFVFSLFPSLYYFDLSDAAHARQEVFRVQPGQPARCACGGLGSRQCEEDRQSPFPALNQQDYPTGPRLMATSMKRKGIPTTTTQCSKRQRGNPGNPTIPRDLRQRCAPIQREI